MASGFFAMVESTLGLTDTDPKDICLEITEAAFVQDGDRALSVLSQLKELGILVALDGFEYSSLNYLMEFPFDVVKIDETFIANIIESKASLAIVAKTIELAHLLDLVVVCEGVETAAQNRKVTDLAADSSQGFYLSRPISAEMVDDLVGSFPPAWVISNHSQASEFEGYGSDAK
jgi:EAL domain-containing protein (putative c-di-GMP-specific phosphodiesterase class I)